MATKTLRERAKVIADWAMGEGLWDRTTAFFFVDDPVESEIANWEHARDEMIRVPPLEASCAT